MPRFSTALCAFLGLAGACPAQESFLEEFDRLDPAVWFVSDGWTNGAHQNCLWSRDAVRVEDGILTLEIAATPGDETALRCGEVQSHRVQRHGTYEVRMRTAAASGVNAAFFTYIGPVHDQPHDEIDEIGRAHV